jgi:5'-3' exonuclease
MDQHPERKNNSSVAEVLSLKAHDSVQAQELFGKINQIKEQMKKLGIAGTLHLHEKENSDKITSMAWDLSKQTGLPVIIVVRAK